MKDESILYLVAQLLDPTQWETYRNTFDVTFPMILFNIRDPADVTEKDIENAHKV